MNKTELISIMADRLGMTKVETRRIVDSMFGIISDTLANEEKVALSGFGSFYISYKDARTGINPRTKKVIEIPAHKLVKFRIGLDLIDRINPRTHHGIQVSVNGI